jgi:hypothetical protein
MPLGNEARVVAFTFAAISISGAAVAALVAPVTAKVAAEPVLWTVAAVVVVVVVVAEELIARIVQASINLMRGYVNLPLVPPIFHPFLPVSFHYDNEVGVCFEWECNNFVAAVSTLSILLSVRAVFFSCVVVLANARHCHGSIIHRCNVHDSIDPGKHDNNGFECQASRQAGKVRMSIDRKETRKKVLVGVTEG